MRNWVENSNCRIQEVFQKKKRERERGRIFLLDMNTISKGVSNFSEGGGVVQVNKISNFWGWNGTEGLVWTILSPSPSPFPDHYSIIFSILKKLIKEERHRLPCMHVAGRKQVHVHWYSIHVNVHVFTGLLELYRYTTTAPYFIYLDEMKGKKAP